MRTAVWFISAACAYLLGGLNTAIVFSKLIYHEDIRTRGSGNPGFTNFKRVYGGRYAWAVFACDILKAVLPCLVFGWAFAACGYGRQTGIAFTCLFSVTGHCFPVWYGFRGGKGFLVAVTSVFFIDWRAGLIAAGVLVLLLLYPGFMSAASLSALTAGAAMLFVFGAELPAAVLFAVSTLIVILRHGENIKRLFSGTEDRFRLGRKKDGTEK